MTKSSLQHAGKIILYVLGFVALAALFYWLLPVAVQSRLSADHVRRAFASTDLGPTAGDSLSSLWTAMLLALKATGLGIGAETFATSAALSAWVALAALALLATYAPWPAVVLVALTPAMLWTSVVPNGAALSIFILVLMGSLSRPSYAYEKRAPWRENLAAVVEGIACVLIPAAWLLIFVRAFRVRYAHGWWMRVNRWRFLYFAVGLAIQNAVGMIIETTTASTSLTGDVAHHFGGVPIIGMLRALRAEDALGAGFVIAGGGGELTLALLASLSVTVAILLSKDWARVGERPASSGGMSRATEIGKWSLLILPFLTVVVAGSPHAWRLAHPGWNTVLEDFAKNVEASFSVEAVAITRTPTEEAALRYVDALLEKRPKMITLRSVNLFEPSTVARVTSREPRFKVTEAEAAVKAGVATGDAAFKTFVDDFIFPNVKRGVQFWMDTFPERATDLEAQFLGNGFRVRGVDGPSKVITDREALRGSFIRARPTYEEFLAGPSLEVSIFERYAVYHLAVARAIEHEKRTADWENRARGEYYAALKKVDWLALPYQKVCVEPEKALATKGAGSESPSEPLDVCIETRVFHTSRH